MFFNVSSTVDHHDSSVIKCVAQDTAPSGGCRVSILVHDESRLASFLANIEDNSVVKFPENIESLKAAERVYTESGGAYLFVLRYKIDKKGLAQLLVSLSDIREYFESDTQPDRNSEYYSDPRRFYRKKGIPGWYIEEMPEGALYVFSGTTGYYLKSRKGKLKRISCVCITLADSEEVVVYMAGDGFYSMKDYGD